MQQQALLSILHSSLVVLLFPSHHNAADDPVSRDHYAHFQEGHPFRQASVANAIPAFLAARRAVSTSHD